MTEYEDRPFALHPAVWTRASGEKVLHVSPWMAKGVLGLDQADADALLHEVCDEIVEATRDLCYFHQWHPSDMVIWDNWRILHSVSGAPRARPVHAPHHERGRLRPRPLRGRLMPAHTDREREALEAYRAYVAQRTRCDRGEAPWSSIADWLTPEAVSVDPAWGRMEGRDAMASSFDWSMVGLDGWEFPEAWTMVDGDHVVSF